MGRYHGKGNGNPLQYSCLENSMDRGAWQVIVPGVPKSQTGTFIFIPKNFIYFHSNVNSIQFSSVIQLCTTLSNPMDCSTPGFPHSSVGKESTCNAGDLGSIPGLGRSLGEAKGYPFQNSGQGRKG